MEKLNEERKMAGWCAILRLRALLLPPGRKVRGQKEVLEMGLQRVDREAAAEHVQRHLRAVGAVVVGRGRARVGVIVCT